MSIDIRLVVDAVSNEKNVPKEIVFPPMVVEKATLANYDVSPDKQSCPTWNTIVK